MLHAALLMAAALAAIDDPNACLRMGSAHVSSYLVMDGRSNTTCGDVDGIRRAAESTTNGNQAVWFSLDGQGWVVRDPAVVGDARTLFKKVNALAEKQGAGAAKQGANAAEQSALSAQMTRELATAQSGLSVLLEKAMKDGKAQKLRPSVKVPRP